MNKLSIFVFSLLLSSQVFALSVSTQNNAPEGIKLTSGSLAQLESYQKKMKKDPNKPFKLEMICYKQKKKKVLGSSITCKAERVRFVEK